MRRLRNTWHLALTSWDVLRRDRELLWLPVLSFVSSLVVFVIFVIPILGGARTENALGETEFELGPMEWVLAAVAGLALTYVAMFFRAAILHAADERLRGGDPNVGSGLRGASARAGRLLPWAIVSVTVSAILQAIEERAGFIGALVVRLVGLAWSLVTFLVLPVLVLEDLGVIAAIRRSAELFKRTWGENVTGQLGFGLLGAVAALPGVAVAALAISSGIGVLVLVGVGAAIVWIAAVAVVVSALGAIFQMALYHYAVDGEVPAAFADAGLENAFEPRRR